MLNKRWLLVFIVLALLIVFVPACGGGDDEPADTPVVTATPVATTTPTITPSSSGPVKIGGIASWSGAAAISGITFADPVIKLVEKQVKDSGGILGGRDVKVVKYDNRASVAEIRAGCTRLLYDEKVSALVWGELVWQNLRQHPILQKNIKYCM